MEIEIKQEIQYAVRLCTSMEGVEIQQFNYETKNYDFVLVEKQSIPALIDALKKYME